MARYTRVFGLAAMDSSTATLLISCPDQQGLVAKIANFSVHTMMDPETNELMFDVFTNFEDVAEANELLAAFQESDQFMPGNDDTQGADDGSSDGIEGDYADGTPRTFSCQSCHMRPVESCRVSPLRVFGPADELAQEELDVALRPLLRQGFDPGGQCLETAGRLGAGE